MVIKIEGLPKCARVEDLLALVGDAGKKDLVAAAARQEKEATGIEPRLVSKQDFIALLDYKRDSQDPEMHVQAINVPSDWGPLDCYRHEILYGTIRFVTRTFKKIEYDGNRDGGS